MYGWVRRTLYIESGKEVEDLFLEQLTERLGNGINS